jgi:tetratricopeptide (TPR) repeat protein
MGVLYKRTGEYEKALNMYQQVLPYAMERDDRYLLGVLYDNMGAALAEMKRFDEAEEYLSKSMAIFSELRADYMVEGAADFVRLYELKKDYSKALEWHKRETALSDSFFNIAKSEQLTEMETKYETEKKQQDIDKLNKEAQLQEAKISRQNLLRNLIIAVTLFVLLIAGILYRNYKRSQRFNKQLEEQKARLEELDVIKNKLFSAISHDLRSPMIVAGCNT